MTLGFQADLLHEEWGGRMNAEEQRILDRQVSDWKKEIGRLAEMISAAKGGGCAVVMIQPVAEGYEDVAPELIVEDALGVTQRGWPTSFQVEILNPSV